MRRALLAWYAEFGRSHLPWRRTRDPYCVVVSEFMLQQTQVERVVPLYERFIARFDSFAALAATERADVVRAWKGLGYNLRALRLHELARAVVERHGGVLPSDPVALRALPGIGPYTLAATRAFAFERDDLAVDVNVRRIRQRFGAGDDALRPHGDAHAWNSALMDLGAMVCTARTPRCLLCPLQPWCRGVQAQTAIASKAPHVPFEQTRRYARGRVLDYLRDAEPGTVLPEHVLGAALDGALRFHRLEEILAALERDGLVWREGGDVRLR